LAPRFLVVSSLIVLLWTVRPVGIGTETPGSSPGRVSTVFADSWLCQDVWAGGSSVHLAWNPCTSRSVIGYRIHYGTESGRYTRTLEVKGRLTAQAVVDDLEEGKTYFFTITSYDAKGKESALSAEITNDPARNGRKLLSPRGSPPGLTPSSDGIPPSKNVVKNPEGKILPNR